MKFILSIFISIAVSIVIAKASSYNYIYNCANRNSSTVSISCNMGQVIIVESAITGVPMEDRENLGNMYMDKTFSVADACTGRNSCVLPDCFSEITSANNCTKNICINVTYSCIFTESSTYGDICHFDGNLMTNTPIHISSFPDFPNEIQATSAFQCSCNLLPNPNAKSVNITFKGLLVTLGGNEPCSHQLNITSGNETVLTICSPSYSTNMTTTVSLSSHPVISFSRRSTVNSTQGKFLLEIKVSDTVSTLTSELGRMWCNRTYQISKSISESITLPTTVTTNGTWTLLENDRMNISSLVPSTDNNKLSTSITTYLENSVNSDSTTEQVLPINQPSASISPGAIVGIVLGSVGFVLLVLVVIFLFIRLRKKNTKEETGCRRETVPNGNSQTSSSVYNVPEPVQLYSFCNRSTHTQDTNSVYSSSLFVELGDYSTPFDGKHSEKTQPTASEDDAKYSTDDDRDLGREKQRNQAIPIYTRPVSGASATARAPRTEAGAISPELTDADRDGTKQLGNGELTLIENTLYADKDGYKPRFLGDDGTNLIDNTLYGSIY